MSGFLKSNKTLVRIRQGVIAVIWLSWLVPTVVGFFVRQAQKEVPELSLEQKKHLCFQADSVFAVAKNEISLGNYTPENCAHDMYFLRQVEGEVSAYRLEVGRMMNKLADFIFSSKNHRDQAEKFDYQQRFNEEQARLIRGDDSEKVGYPFLAIFRALLNLYLLYFFRAFLTLVVKRWQRKIKDLWFVDSEDFLAFSLSMIFYPIKIFFYCGKEDGLRFVFKRYFIYYQQEFGRSKKAFFYALLLTILYMLICSRPLRFSTLVQIQIETCEENAEPDDLFLWNDFCELVKEIVNKFKKVFSIELIKPEIGNIVFCWLFWFLIGHPIRSLPIEVKVDNPTNAPNFLTFCVVNKNQKVNFIRRFENEENIFCNSNGGADINKLVGPDDFNRTGF